ncbi:MAG: MOSC domain-containing protein [Thermomicrobiales bacterium]
MSGDVIAIHITSGASEPMQSLDRAEAIAGQGLSGDRYQTGSGFYSQTPTTPGARELTLIAEEALNAVAVETGIEIPLHEHRRNITTRGIDVDALLGQQFRIGGALCEGVRACPPCNHLDELTGKPLLKPLAQRGGLRARIVTGGEIRVGDRIEPLGAASDGAAPEEMAATRA